MRLSGTLFVVLMVAGLAGCAGTRRPAPASATPVASTSEPARSSADVEAPATVESLADPDPRPIASEVRRVIVGPDFVLEVLIGSEEIIVRRHTGEPVSASTPDELPPATVTDLDALAAAAARFKERHPDADQVVISAEKATPFRRVVEVMDRLRAVGFPNVILSAAP